MAAGASVSSLNLVARKQVVASDFFAALPTVN